MYLSPHYTYTALRCKCLRNGSASGSVHLTTAVDILYAFHIAVHDCGVCLVVVHIT